MRGEDYKLWSGAGFVDQAFAEPPRLFWRSFWQAKLGCEIWIHRAQSQGFAPHRRGPKFMWLWSSWRHSEQRTVLSMGECRDYVQILSRVCWVSQYTYRSSCIDGIVYTYSLQFNPSFCPIECFSGASATHNPDISTRAPGLNESGLRKRAESARERETG